ncbi:MAG: MoaD/ThiS family protein, partial [Chloroflexota bacterium]
MRVRVRCFASLRELAVDRAELELDDGARVEDAWNALAARHPALWPHRPFTRAARNGAYADWDAPIADGDEVAFLPPVSGGATTTLTEEPIDVAALEASVAGSGHGAVVTFVGRARDRSDDGREVVELEYEVYPELAAAVLEQVASEAERRWSVS